MINFHQSSSDEEYNNERLSLLKLTEGVRNLSYLDTKQIPSIGIGFNLRDPGIFDLVTDEVAAGLTAAEREKLSDVISASYSSDSQLTSAISSAISAFRKENRNAPKSYAFSSTAQILTVLNKAVVTYEGRVDSWLANIPKSQERTVLLSLAYNGLINAGASPTLKSDVLTGNRADAWYQIRYKSNGGASGSGGIANRRYIEATEFGLYDDAANPNQADALKAAQSYTDHRSTILDYEDTYKPADAAKTKSYPVVDIYKSLMPAVSTLREQYNIPSSFTIEEVQAATTATPNLNGDETDYDNAANDQDLLIGSAAANKLVGGVGNDAIVGNGGSDTIDGGADTDTAFYSGKAIDYNITHNADGSWTVDNVRGTKIDGQDSLTNVEKISFSDASFDLKPDHIFNQIDLSFVIDTTGSMSPYINNVKENASKLIDDAFKSGTRDAHISVVSFKDSQQGYPNNVVLSFTTQNDLAARKSAALAAINSLSASGGGDTPETDNAGLLLALNGSAGKWRDSAGQRKIALFTDAPVKDTDLAATVNKYAHELGVTVGTHLSALASFGAVDKFSLSGSTTASFDLQIYTILVGDNSSAQADLKKIAADTGGAFFTADSTNLSETLSKIIDLPAGALKPRTDINNDDTSDLILQSSSNYVYGWTVQDNGVEHAVKLGASSYKVVASGDFDGDGTADLVLKKGSSVLGWTMKDGAVQAKASLGTNSYRVAGTGDFNGDGTTDILFQGTQNLQLWTMKDGKVQSKATIGANSAKVVGTGDFNGDGTTDILFQKGDAITSWTMRDGHMELANIISQHAGGFAVKGTGDFDGNGTTDILLQKSDTTVDWMIKDNHVDIANVLWAHMGSNKFAATGDYNGDGVTDVAFQSGRTVTALSMADGEASGSHTLSTGATGLAVRPV